MELVGGAENWSWDVLEAEHVEGRVYWSLDLLEAEPVGGGAPDGG